MRAILWDVLTGWLLIVLIVCAYWALFAMSSREDAREIESWRDGHPEDRP